MDHRPLLIRMAAGLRGVARVPDLVPPGSPELLSAWVGARCLRLADEIETLATTDEGHQWHHIRQVAVADFQALAVDPMLQGSRAAQVAAAAVGVLMRIEALEGWGDEQLELLEEDDEPF